MTTINMQRYYTGSVDDLLEFYDNQDDFCYHQHSDTEEEYDEYTDELSDYECKYIYEPSYDTIREAIVFKKSHIIKKYLEKYYLSLKRFVINSLSNQGGAYRRATLLTRQKKANYFVGKEVYDVLEFLLKCGYNSNEKYGHHGDTLLHLAVALDDTRLASMLMQYNTDIDCEDYVDMDDCSDDMARIICSTKLASLIYCFDKLNRDKWLYDKQINTLFS